MPEVDELALYDKDSWEMDQRLGDDPPKKAPPLTPVYELIPPFKLAEAFGVDRETAERAIGHLGYLFRQVA